MFPRRTAANRDDILNIPQRQARLLRLLLLLTVPLFVLGIFLPMITLTKLVFFENSFSVVSGIMQLFKNGQYPLFTVVVVFSVMLPTMKMVVLYLILTHRSHHRPTIERYLNLMHEYGRWAMLDVMVVAVLIVTVKLGAVASIEVHAGLYVFGAAVLSIMYITHRIVRLTEKSKKQE